MAHHWFSSIDIPKLLKKQLKAPWLPEKTGDLANYKYFNVKEGEELAETIIPTANLKAIRNHQEQFSAFQQKSDAYRKNK